MRIWTAGHRSVRRVKFRRDTSGRTALEFGLGVSLFLALSGLALGQTTGVVSGSIVDTSGGALPGSTIEVTSPNLQGVRVTRAGSDGRFRLPALPPGRYLVRASLAGFRTIETETTVTLDATFVVSITLEPSASERVEVSGKTSPIDTSSTTTGSSYTSQVVDRLPVARNYADIVKSNPGVSTDRGATEGRSLTLSIYGATSAENQWIIDGVNTTNVLNGVQGKAINNEFVQEIEVKTGGYQAEYGRALGGVVNVITRSGGNEFHGDGFVYYDSTATAAEKEFRAGDSGLASMRVVDGERFDYGFDLGGFLLKDRLWFFGAYNRVSIQSEVSRLESSPHVSTEDRFPIDAADNLYSGKLTWNPGASTTIVGTVFADPTTSSGAAGADPRQGLGVGLVTPPVSLEPSTWYSERFQGGTDFGVRLTHLLGSRAIATLQGSYHKDKNELTAADDIRYEDRKCEGGTPDAPCGRPPEPNSVTGGFGPTSGFFYTPSSSERQQYSVGGTLYAGEHEVKLGGDYQDGRTKTLQSYSGDQQVRIQNEYGQLYYRHEFFAAGPDDPTPVPGDPNEAEVLDYGVYLQDSWKPASNLTVNLGLRWDGEQTRIYDGQTVLSFSEWQPRVGVVWDPWRSGQTKVYAFAGRFSYAFPSAAASRSFGNQWFFRTYNFDPVDTTPDPNVINHPTEQNGGASATPVDPDARGWYQDELTVGIERLLDPTLTVGLKGTYRTLRNVVEDRCDLDSSVPETNYSDCGLMNPGSSEPIASGNIPTCNGLDDPYHECGIDPGPATPDVSRIYRGIEILARKSIGTSLWLQASYVYSSLRGNYDGGVNQGTFGQTWPGINSDFDYPQLSHNAYGILALDRPHRFRFDGYWISPWRLSVGLQAFAESGAPLSRLGYLNESLPPVVYLDPRGSDGRLPTLWGANLSFSYPIAIGPAMVTLQAYLFNVFDKQIAIFRNEWWSTKQPEGYPATIYDPDQAQMNTDYGKVMDRSSPRVFRAAVKASF
jgi:outer membrane receptor protein involved in Fe transport